MVISELNNHTSPLGDILIRIKTVSPKPSHSNENTYENMVTAIDMLI